MTVPRPPVHRVLPLLLGILLVSGAAGAWWLDTARPVPPDELVRAEAWLVTEALLGTPGPAAERTDVRADLDRQLEALGPAPDDRARAAVGDPGPSPADGAPADGEADGDTLGDAGAPSAAALRTTAMALAEDALAAEDPALARVLAAAAVSRSAAARQLEGGTAPAGADLCDATAGPAGGAGETGAVLWSALDRAGYSFEALAARAGSAAQEPGPDGAAVAAAAERGVEDVEELLGAPAARPVLEAAPGLAAGAYVLPADVREHPGRAADAAARDVQDAAAHVLARGDAGSRCWALVALERATGLRAGLTGEVGALPGVLRDDPPR
ncbi:hypothetical protein [Kocuria sp. NPDC057446]|uniref:hypothetical protein n=1 Tax=Kocuria sp. NPDC057446 TaxID=3346137 RepID=UPI00367BFC5B